MWPVCSCLADLVSSWTVKSDTELKTDNIWEGVGDGGVIIMDER